MAIDAKNVLVGGPDQETTGAILSGGPEAVLPTAPGEAAGDDWEDSGYISEDGLHADPRTVNDRDQRLVGCDHQGNLGGIQRHSGVGSFGDERSGVEELLQGDDNVKVTPATESTGRIIKASMGATDMPRKPWQFRVKDGKAKVLIVVPDGQVSEQGEVAFTKTNAITWPITLKTFPDADGYNVPHLHR